MKAVLAPGLTLVHGCWLKHVRSGARPPSPPPRLRVGIERYPLNADTIRRALAPFVELAELREHLLAALPRPSQGWHHLRFDDVELILIHAPIDQALNAIDSGFDAWFLDGFAPARNGDMWQDSVLARIARLLVPGGSAATFTAAGFVRRSLMAAGLTVHKRPGFGRKREMLCARQEHLVPAQDKTPWFRHPPTPRCHCRSLLLARYRWCRQRAVGRSRT